MEAAEKWRELKIEPGNCTRSIWRNKGVISVVDVARSHVEACI